MSSIAAFACRVAVDELCWADVCLAVNALLLALRRASDGEALFLSTGSDIDVAAHTRRKGQLNDPTFEFDQKANLGPKRATAKMQAIAAPTAMLRRSLIANATGSPSTSPRRAIIQMRFIQ